MEQNTEISSKIEGTYGSSSHRSLAKNLPPWLESGYASKVVTTVIVNCIRLNSAIGLEGQKVVKVSLTADPSQIEQYAESISKLEYNKAVNVVKRDNAVATGRNLQRRLNETVYWDIILKGAKLIDTATLPRAKGPDDGFEPAEKAAAKRLMEDLGYGLSPESQRQHRTLWKALFDMRKAGISKFLIYRTQEFDTYCKSYPRRCAVTLVNRVTEWERVYRSYIEHLENLVTRFIEGDVARRAYLTYAAVAARINIPGLSWNDASNAWFSPDEEYSFTVKDGAVAVLPDNLGVAFGGRSLLADEKDKAIFMLLSPRDDKFLSVRPLIPVDAGDFLGIFPGKIRYSREFTPKWGIPGPDEGLWLDYSQTTGTLTQMRVAQPGDYANVRLHWELFSETDTSRPRWLWRVSVRALEAIAPLEELVREAYHEEQYLLHQSSLFSPTSFHNIDEWVGPAQNEHSLMMTSIQRHPKCPSKNYRIYFGALKRSNGYKKKNNDYEKKNDDYEKKNDDYEKKNDNYKTKLRNN
ncbi:hypothetical protein N8T08_001709 [Aspergillus melleus]|uniref:Uncharacterized protein n=1 Tax=Aspergillus melleus TaxID=138277 RepID=A0ACC3ANF7_9EURO|nr:hypothetical protein N8T08_001709 [Aspergillus melleus]